MIEIDKKKKKKKIQPKKKLHKKNSPTTHTQSQIECLSILLSEKIQISKLPTPSFAI